MADIFAYEATGPGDEFGIIDLTTGVFTALSNMGLTFAGLGSYGGVIYGGAYHGYTLYSINPSTGALTAIGTGNIGNNYLLFGSTTSGLYGIGWDDVLYSINPATGAATQIGSTGLPIGGVMGISAGGNTLYVTTNNSLYAVDTTNGSATLIASTNEGEIGFGALVSIGGVLYGGAYNGASTPDIYNLNPQTGAATFVAASPSTPSASGVAGFDGLAPISQQTLTTTYDVLRDFNTTGIQPASADPFTYATEISLNVGFTLLRYYGNTSSSVGGSSTTTDGTVNDYYFAQPLQFSGPSIAVVATGNTLTFPSSVPLIVPDDVLVMMPGSPEFNAPDLIVTRFTAPSAGTFDIAGSFADLQKASVDLIIVVDGTTVFSSSFSGRGPYQGTIPFSIAGIALHAGDTIDFVVDSLGTQAFDVVGLKAQITETSVMPTVTSITAATDNGATDLNSGHVITISLNLSAVVYFTGNPFLLLNDNEIATYTTGSGTNSLTFTYTVQQGDNVPNLEVTGLNLNGGTIQDGAGAALAGPIQGDLALQIDTTAPTVAVSIDNTTLNLAHNTATVTFTFSEAPTDFSLNDVTSADGSLSNLSGSGTTYTAAFTANAGVDDDAATVSVTNGSYHDAAGNAGTGAGTMSPVKFSSAVATFTGVDESWAPSQMIDGIFTGPPGRGGTYAGINGWSVYNTATGKSEGADALLTIASPLPAGQYNLTFTIYQNYYGNPGHILGDFALDYTTAASPTLSSPQTPVSIESAASLNGTTFSLLSPGELLANTSQNSIGTDTYTISAVIDSASPITGIFLDAIKNPALPGGGPGGQYGNGNFVVSEFTLDAAGTGSTAPFTVDTVTPTVAVSIDNTFINQAHTTGRVTFAFSEAPTAFTLADTSAVGGTLSNLQQTDGTHYSATLTGGAQTRITNASVSVTAGSWQESNGNSGASSSTALFEVDTLTTPLPPTIIVNSYPAATRGQMIALSTLVAISDGFGLGFQELELWDSQGTAFGGQFVVKGVARTGGHEIDLSPADVTKAVFDVGTLGGIDTLWARLLQNDGTLTAWQQFAVAAPIDTPPVMIVSNRIATHDHSFSASSLFVASDPDGDAITEYDFWNSGAGGGHFVLNSQVLGANQDNYISASQLAQTTYQSGSGADTLWVRVSDGAQWSPWSQSFTVTAPVDTGPVVAPLQTNMSVLHGQSLAASSLFTASDPFNDPITQYDFWNAGAGGGNFVVSGQPRGANQDNYVSEAQLAQTVYRSGSGTDTLWVRVSDGAQWSPWSQSFTVTAPIDTGPVVVPTSTKVSATHNQSFAISNLFIASDPFGDPITTYDFWNTGTGAGHFVVNGQVLGPNQENLISAAQLGQATYQSGSGTDTLWVRVSDGDQWSPWSQSFTVTAPVDNGPVVVPTTTNVSATHNQSFAASSLFTASDPFGDAIAQYDFWNSGSGGGHFLLNNQVLGASQENFIPAAQLAQTAYKSGSGADTLWVRVSDGEAWSAWSQSFTVTAPIDSGPAVTSVANIKTTAGQSFAASSLFTASDPFGDPIKQYDFWDTGAGGGHFMLNGQALGTTQDNYILSGQLPQTNYVSGSGTDTLWVRVSEGGQWSPWSPSFTVSDPTTISAGQTLELASAFSGKPSFAADTGTLKLDNSATFAGTVAGMTGHDTIDFADIDPAKVQTPSYAGDPSGGTLTVTDGLHSANIALLGNYLASTFATSSDGHDGTNVIQHATTAQTPLLAQPQN